MEIVTGGTSVTVALVDFVRSAALVAVTVTDCALVIEDGAVYRPEMEIVPTTGFRPHVTPVFEVPVTDVVNCWLCEAPTETDAGDMETATGGFNVTVAVAN
jgi:hypothetical protein